MYNEGKKYLFSVDVETDGLYGDVFAIGVTVWKLDNPIHPVTAFAGQCEKHLVKDPFVKEYIVPVITEDFYQYKSKRFMRNMFWNFYKSFKDESIILADFGAPCEAYLFRQCVLDNPSRQFDGPYPLHDLATMFYMKGIDPDIDRFVFLNKVNSDLVRHNPLHDSIIAAECFFKLNGISIKHN